MAGAAYDLMQEFWRIQDGRDYRAVVALFADDAVFEDPIYGRHEGKPAIDALMAKMSVDMNGQGITFDLVELSGAEVSAWAKWVAHSARGDREGVGIYKVANGKITYYRDYLDPRKEG